MKKLCAYDWIIEQAKEFIVTHLNFFPYSWLLLSDPNIQLPLTHTFKSEGMA